MTKYYITEEYLLDISGIMGNPVEMEWSVSTNIKLWRDAENYLEMRLDKYPDPDVWVETRWNTIQETLKYCNNIKLLFEGDEAECRKYLMGLELIK